MRPYRWRCLTAVALASAATLTLAGCGYIHSIDYIESIDDTLKSNLSDMVAGAQDAVWDLRAELAVDPEAALPAVEGMSDARSAAEDPTTPRGIWEVLEVSQSDHGATLTLVTSAGAVTGGGWMYQSKQAYTCFSLTVTDDEIVTAPAGCEETISLTLFDRSDDDMTFMPLDEVSFRPHVDSTDHPEPICQCYSGSPCECPGG